MTKKILVVDDEREIVKVVRAYLEDAGFSVVTAADGQEALTVFRHEKPALVILDWMLPKLSGIDACRTLRKESDVPIIMLTARVEETDKLIGLELGADDYVTKPFSPRELVARVRAVLRRAEGGEAPPEIVEAGGMRLDLASRTVEVRGKRVDLTPTEFDLLAVLAQNPGRVFTRMQLLDKVQGYAYEGYERTIDVHIKNLRQKIEETPSQPRHIVTVYGVGYRFEA
ncbi:MAG: response regulator transcription factor [Anaerolineae bacterium]|jgi:DNA-binding response OmpR family regulator|nr:response regulator transcription factor [Anaerolineae bacterium]